LLERYQIWLQIHALATTRRLLALWHLLHVPLGVVLFTLALVHIVAALYYSTFLK
jgi:cytochrome b subunit of formate dehydrogenase